MAVRLRPTTKADGTAAETVLFAQGDFGLAMKKPGVESHHPDLDRRRLVLLVCATHHYGASTHKTSKVVGQEGECLHTPQLGG